MTGSAICGKPSGGSTSSGDIYLCSYAPGHRGVCSWASCTACACETCKAMEAFVMAHARFVATDTMDALYESRAAASKLMEAK